MNKKVSKTFKVIILIVFIILFTVTTGIWRMLKELKTLLQKYFGTSSPKPLEVKKSTPVKKKTHGGKAAWFNLGDW